MDKGKEVDSKPVEYVSFGQDFYPFENEVIEKGSYVEAPKFFLKDIGQIRIEITKLYEWTDKVGYSEDYRVINPKGDGHFEIGSVRKQVGWLTINVPFETGSEDIKSIDPNFRCVLTIGDAVFKSDNEVIKGDDEFWAEFRESWGGAWFEEDWKREGETEGKEILVPLDPQILKQIQLRFER